MKQFTLFLLFTTLSPPLVVAGSAQESSRLANDDECLTATRHELSITERNTTTHKKCAITSLEPFSGGDTRPSYTVVEWVVENGGYFNPKQVFRHNNGDTTIVARQDISKGDVLARIPWKCTFTADTDASDSELFCDTASLLLEEMNKANNNSESFYAPYISYLKAHSPRLTPSTYSDEGKELFETIIGKNQLPPKRATLWMGKYWAKECGGSLDDKHARDAVMSLVSRGDDDILTPLYDMYNHGNGKLHNAKAVVKQDEYVLIKARRDIPAGHEVLHSYNQCSDCGKRILQYGTPELFREYGFIEQYPQRWIFHDEEIAFDVDLDEESGELEVTFLDDDVSKALDDLYEVTEWGVNTLKAHLDRLIKLNETTLQPLLEKESLPHEEMDSIMSYYKALTQALELGIEAAKEYKYIVRNDGKPEKKKAEKENEKTEDLYAPHVAEEVPPGELSLLKWQDTNDIIDPYAAQVGLPDKLVPTIKAYANRLGIFDIVKDFLYNDPCEPKHGRFYHIRNPFARNDETLHSTNDEQVMEWYTQRPGGEWQSDMHWFAPSNERTHETTIQLLKEGGIEEALDVIGRHFDLDALAIQSAGFLAVTHCEEGYLHTDFKNVEGKVFNFLIPLHSPVNAEEELRVVGERIRPNATNPGDEDEVKVGTKIKYDERYGVLVGDGTWHGTRECDHRPTGDIRIVFSVYLVDLTEDNLESVAYDDTAIFPVPGMDEWLWAQRGRHWMKDATMAGDLGRRDFKPVDFSDDCPQLAAEGKCETKEKSTRRNCPKSCSVFMNDWEYQPGVERRVVIGEVGALDDL